MEKKNQSKGFNHIADTKIIRRVKQYLEDHKDIVEIDLDDMADCLQKKHSEYMRREKKAFQGLVARAFGAVVKEYERESQMGDIYDDDEGDDDNDISSVESDYESIHEYSSNRGSEQQTSVYFQKSRDQGGEKELINISSSDDEPDDENVNKDIRQSILKNSMPNITIVPIKSQSTKSHGSFSIPFKSRPNSNMNSKQSMQKSSVVKNPTSVKFSGIQKSKKTDTNSKKRKPNIDNSVGLGSQKSSKKKKLSQLENEFKQGSNIGEFGACRSKVTFKDFAGNKEMLKELSKVILHVAQPKIYSTLGISPPRGLLLTGPPGCGKTLLAEAIAGELNVLLLKVSASEMVSGVSGQSEEHIRDLFNQALSLAPCVLLLEEVDAITPNRHTAQREMERRIVCQLLSCLDELGPKEYGQHVLVIGTTNRPDSIDPALRRAGRFDTEFALGIPGVEARTEILKTVCKSLKLEPHFDYEKMARLTPGYVGADLMSLARTAAINAFFRYFENTRQNLGSRVDKNQKKSNTSSDMEISDDDSPGSKVNGVPVVGDSESRKEKSSDSVGNSADENICGWLCKQPPLSDKQLEGLCITAQDFIVALKKVCPSAKREGFATVPDVTWEDVGALHDIRQALQIAILAPVKYTKLFASVGISAPAGVLLCGPPGCGKTLLAKAVANEAGINFISVKGPELLNMYLGESERAVRQCFQRAKNSAPCVIFFDELDALCPKRSEGGEGGASMRVVNQMLTEMDGVEERGGVFLMAATNRPDIVDPAVLRPGRLDKILYVGFPSISDKIDILRTLTKNGTKPELADDVNLEEISTWENCEGYTGADLAALVKEAAIIAIQEVLGEPAEKVVVSRNHFVKAVKNIRPSVTRKDQLYYEKLQKLYSPTPVKKQDHMLVAPEASVELSSSSSVTSQQRNLSETTQQNSAVSSLSAEQHETLQETPVQITEADVALKDSSHGSCKSRKLNETAEHRDTADKQSSDVDSTLDVDRSPQLGLGSCS